METLARIEQLKQIALRPTWSGDLISKYETKELRRRKLVRWKENVAADLPSSRKLIGGYVLTWRGKIVVMALRWLGLLQAFAK